MSALRTGVVLFATIAACRVEAAQMPSERPPASDAGGPRHATPAQVTEDLRAILGGRFSVDHIGPAAFEAVLARLRADPRAYLDAVRERYVLGGTPDGPPTIEALPGLLGRLYPLDPDRTRRVASELLAAYRARARTSAEDPGRQRVDVHIESLEVLSHGVDTHMEADWVPLAFDRVCATVFPGPDGDMEHGLRVVNDCTCGRPQACRARVVGDRIELDARLHEDGPLRCLDCHVAWTTCSLPQLEPSTTYTLVSAGRTLGELASDPSGWLARGACQTG